MASEGIIVLPTTFAAAEDLSGGQYHAVAMDDRKYAANGREAIGILRNKPLSGAHASVCVIGESKFRAGGAISAGDFITVAGSGWLTECASGQYAVGECREDVTSGSIGVGFFNFATKTYQVNSLN